MSTTLLCHVELVETSLLVIPATLLCHVELVETSLHYGRDDSAARIVLMRQPKAPLFCFVFSGERENEGIINILIND